MRKAASRVDTRLRPDAVRGVRYWERRARAMGERAVTNASASKADLTRIAAEQRRIMFPILQSELAGDERLILDFGCGPGRFTAELATLIGGREVGVDPVAGLL